MISIQRRKGRQSRPQWLWLVVSGKYQMAMSGLLGCILRQFIGFSLYFRKFLELTYITGLFLPLVTKTMTHEDRNGICQLEPRYHPYVSNTPTNCLAPLAMCLLSDIYKLGALDKFDGFPLNCLGNQNMTIRSTSSFCKHDQISFVIPSSQLLVVLRN